jgi:hypothetical protein
MRNKLNLLVFLLTVVVFFKANEATASAPCTKEATYFCSDTSFAYNYYDGESCTKSPIDIYFYFKVDASGLPDLEISSLATMDFYFISGPYETAQNICTIDTTGIEINYLNTSDATSYNTGTDIGTLSEGYYYILIRAYSCASTISFDASEGELVCNNPLPCENCIGSFAPQPGQKYLISTWVKEDDAPPSKTAYTEPEVYIEFPSASTTLGPFTPTGVIIDGWQKVESEFEIPLTATDMVLRLECASGECFFDDIRIFPYDGSMKTYVYDPTTLRLVAELDERNYATFYEYDEEGKLMRIKKETERGIMTIQENKTSITKR